MRIIKKLSEMIDEELADSRRYIVCAEKYKGTDEDLAKLFYQLSIEEMGHVKMLHDAVVNKIEEYRRTKGEPPALMQELYDYIHEQEIEDTAEIKRMQTAFRG